ncbi:MAG: SPFH domain-containing protein [Patescibacteria group bacterium]
MFGLKWIFIALLFVSPVFILIISKPREENEDGGASAGTGSKTVKVPKINELDDWERIARMIWVFIILIPIMAWLGTSLLFKPFDLSYQRALKKSQSDSTLVQTSVTAEETKAPMDWYPDFQKKGKPWIYVFAYLGLAGGLYWSHRVIFYIPVNNVAVFEAFGGYSFSARYYPEFWKRITCTFYPYERVRMAEPDEYPVGKDNNIQYYPKFPWLISLKVQIIDPELQPVNTKDGVVGAKVDWVLYFQIPWEDHLKAVYAVKELYPSALALAKTVVLNLSAKEKLADLIGPAGLTRMSDGFFKEINAIMQQWGLVTIEHASKIQQVIPPEGIITEMNDRAKAFITKEKGTTLAELDQIQKEKSALGLASKEKFDRTLRAEGYDELAKKLGLEEEEKKILLVLDTLQVTLASSDYSVFSSTAGTAELAAAVRGIKTVLDGGKTTTGTDLQQLEKMLAGIKSDPEQWKRVEEMMAGIKAGKVKPKPESPSAK